MQITDVSLKLFLAYARDAPNWSGMPLVGGNVPGDAKAQRGNLTQLKQAGLLFTETYPDHPKDVWIRFTEKGKELAALHGIDIRLTY